MMLRPGNAGSNTASEHIAVLSDALAQLPRGYRRQILIRLDGAGASHALIEHLLSLSTARRKVAFTSGFTITAIENATGWRYQLVVTNISDLGRAVPGSHYVYFVDTLHRQHATVQDRVCTEKATGLRALPFHHAASQPTHRENKLRETGSTPASRTRNSRDDYCRRIGVS